MRFSGAVGHWFLQRQAQLTLELLRALPGARVLDVGGGHGQLTRPLLEAGHPVTVLASSAALILLFGAPGHGDGANDAAALDDGQSAPAGHDAAAAGHH